MRTYASPLPPSYHPAFEAIEADPNNELVVAVLADRVIGVLQLTLIPSITYRGGWRALIEGVRVDASLRSQGIGRQLFEWAIERARERGCHLVQLTSDKARPDAISASWPPTRVSSACCNDYGVDLSHRQ